MCGICGAVSLGSSNIAPVFIQRMVDTLRHRGPDDGRIHVQAEAGLGHARLSIIDLSRGAQPMSNPDGSVWISFNGEIFNYIELRDELIRKGHRFTTSSDTEVLLHLYEEEGEACVERLNGQWAFAVWDVRRKKLLLSRDRMGVRPLFYTTADGRFLFASEIKALRTCPGVSCELDARALDQIFTFWAPLPPHTAFRNIFQLPPAHSLTVENGQVRVWRYWRPGFPPAAGMAGGTEEELAEELQTLLLDATRLRLRSDVPVGAYLSGGLDSTLIAALTARVVGDNLRTFSVSFEDEAFDETPFQTEAVSFLRTNHAEVRCTRDDIARVFPEVIWHTEQPILRTAPAPLFLLSRLVRNSGFKVVLTGEGADETMGGYDIFKEVKIRRFCQRNPASSWRPQLLKRLYPYLENIQQQPPAYLAGFFRLNAAVPGPFFSHVPRWELTARIKAFFSRDLRDQLGGYDAVADVAGQLPEAYGSWDAFLQAQFLETEHLLPGYILASQGDRVAMAHSVEGRLPYLDPRVVDFAAKLPVRLKMKVLREKHLLRCCADGLVPPSIRDRVKQPYRAPEGNCFLEPAAREYVGDLLSPHCLRRYGIFEPAPVSRLLAKFRSGQAIGAKDNMALTGIVSTQLVAHQFIDRFNGTVPCHANSGRVEAVRH